MEKIITGTEEQVCAEILLRFYYYYFFEILFIKKVFISKQRILLYQIVIKSLVPTPRTEIRNS